MLVPFLLPEGGLEYGDCSCVWHAVDDLVLEYGDCSCVCHAVDDLVLVMSGLSKLNMEIRPQPPPTSRCGITAIEAPVAAMEDSSAVGSNFVDGNLVSNDMGESESSSDSSDSEEDMTWISWFINLRGNEFFVAVDVDYINDDFNLTGLSAMVSLYK